MQKHKYLLTYRYSEIIHDLTTQFSKRYIPPKSRTVDQMDQAARSGKQNIVEGVSFGLTSKGSEIKLLGVSLASFEELIADLEDQLRQNNLETYPKADPRVTRFKHLAYQLSNLSNLSDRGYLKEKSQLYGNLQDDANFLLTLCHIITYLLDRQIKASIKKFTEEGGVNEKLHNLRKDYLRGNK